MFVCLFWKKTRHKKNRSKVTNILSKMPNWKLPKIETNFTTFEVWSTKIELPKIEITNIEGYQYRGIPVSSLCLQSSPLPSLDSLLLKKQYIWLEYGMHVMIFCIFSAYQHITFKVLFMSFFIRLVRFFHSTFPSVASLLQIVVSEGS